MGSGLRVSRSGFRGAGALMQMSEQVVMGPY